MVKAQGKTARGLHFAVALRLHPDKAPVELKFVAEEFFGRITEVCPNLKGSCPRHFPDPKAATGTKGRPGLTVEQCRTPAGS